MYTNSIKHTKFNKNSQNVSCAVRCHVWTKSWDLMTDEINCIFFFLERKLVNQSDLTEHNRRVIHQLKVKNKIKYMRTKFVY